MGSQCVLGFMISTLSSSMFLKTRYFANLKIKNEHTASYICESIKKIVLERFNENPYYFVSYCAPENKAAVRIYMQSSGVDDY